MASEPPRDWGSCSASRGSRQRTCENQTSWGRAGRAGELITFLFSMQATQRQKRSLEEVHWTPRQYTHIAPSCCSFFVFLRAHTRTHMAVTVGAHTHAHTHFVHRNITWNLKHLKSFYYYYYLLFIIFLWFLAQQSSSKWWWRWWCGQDRRSVTSDRQKPIIIIIIINNIINIISSAVNGLL